MNGKENWDEAALQAAEEDALAAALAKAEMEREEQQWAALPREEQERQRRQLWAWLNGEAVGR